MLAENFSARDGDDRLYFADGQVAESSLIETRYRSGALELSARWALPVILSAALGFDSAMIPARHHPEDAVQPTHLPDLVPGGTAQTAWRQHPGPGFERAAEDPAAAVAT